MTDLLVWYEANRRDLPWRRDRDPYRIWLSEVMLQQTRVESAIPYFERFLERFPTVQALAAAEITEVLALWSGLGYYRRARQLHRAAEEIVAGGGPFPRTLEDLLRLPGIGPYTAAAVGSIAFDLPIPVLDGNVERVMARLLAYPGDPKKKEGRRALTAKAEALLDPERPGDSNQALMELGATVCTPRQPRCPACPLAWDCRARADGTPEAFPWPRSKRGVEKVRMAVAVVRRGERVLLFRRPEGSRLLAGTWELPWVEQIPTEGARKGPKKVDPLADQATERSEIEQALGDRYGGSWSLGPERGRVRHRITFRAIEARVFEAQRAEQAAEPGEVAEGTEPGSDQAPGPEPFTATGHFGPRQRLSLPLSSLVEKVLAVLA